MSTGIAMSNTSLNPIKNVQEYIKLPLLYEYWYVAGLVEEFGQALQAKTLLELSIVFFRRTDGVLVALQNRCAHRSFPLAESKLIGDEIQCGYHGIRYNSEGEIVNVPCQTRCPAVRLRKYPVAERGPLVWIWMGDPDNANEADIPETDCLTNANWTSMWGRKTLEGNYLLMHENLADLSHLPFLHKNTFGAPGDWASVEVEVKREGDMVHYWRSTGDWGMASSL
jgi:vanillate O-demethylase monooxygenase subunit